MRKPHLKNKTHGENNFVDDNAFSIKMDCPKLLVQFQALRSIAKQKTNLSPRFSVCFLQTMFFNDWFRLWVQYYTMCNHV